MIDLAALTKTLPESLRPAVLSAWEIFRQNAAERSDDELPDHLLQSLPAVWATSPFIAGHCARRPELLFQLSDSGRLARPMPRTNISGCWMMRSRASRPKAN